MGLSELYGEMSRRSRRLVAVPNWGTGVGMSQ